MRSKCKPLSRAIFRESLTFFLGKQSSRGKQIFGVIAESSIFKVQYPNQTKMRNQKLITPIA
jgi:hypothetical protein